MIYHSPFQSAQYFSDGLEIVPDVYSNNEKFLLAGEYLGRRNTT